MTNRLSPPACPLEPDVHVHGRVPPTFLYPISWRADLSRKDDSPVLHKEPQELELLYVLDLFIVEVDRVFSQVDMLSPTEMMFSSSLLRHSSRFSLAWSSNLRKG